MQHEVEDLRNKGFLPSEARRLVQLPNWQQIPWAAQIVTDRARSWAMARRRGVKRQSFDNSIVETYQRNDWLVRGYAGQVVLDTYAMIRSHCDIYRRRNPDYESPWEERQRDFGRYARAVDNTTRLKREGNHR